MSCDLCLQRMSHKSTENYLKKEEAQKAKYVFENIYFQKSWKTKDLYQKWWNNLEHFRKPNGPVNSEAKSRPHKTKTNT